MKRLYIVLLLFLIVTLGGCFNIETTDTTNATTIKTTNESTNTTTDGTTTTNTTAATTLLTTGFNTIISNPILDELVDRLIELENGIRTNQNVSLSKSIGAKTEIYEPITRSNLAYESIKLEYNIDKEFLYFSKAADSESDYEGYTITKGATNLIKVVYNNEIEAYQAQKGPDVFNISEITGGKHSLSYFFSIVNYTNSIELIDESTYEIQVKLLDILDDNTILMLNARNFDFETNDSMALQVEFMDNGVRLRALNNPYQVGLEEIDIYVSIYCMLDEDIDADYKFSKRKILLTNDLETTFLFKETEVLYCLSDTSGYKYIAYQLEPGIYSFKEDFVLDRPALVYNQNGDILMRESYRDLTIKQMIFVQEPTIIYIKLNWHYPIDRYREYRINKTTVVQDIVQIEDLKLQQGSFNVENENADDYSIYSFERPAVGGYLTINVVNYELLNELETGNLYITSMYHLGTINIFEEDQLRIYVEKNEQARIIFSGSVGVNLEIEYSFVEGPEEES